ncbi:site-specific integrase [Noviherbaspirillum galbum]|uniref:Tyrosine-type recombinase/integrase n=1 Tax=Noviherbaspirillum galbum TaxID=2709383 RepID=A0A6B3SLP4_9BURK|nr:site-specific integrase [Noviherbaspirillum galbum]NEX61733.1 tyrosine-type recombinase/integrase [Noviherbaspirillum galbum]
MKAKITRELLRDFQPTDKVIDIADSEVKGFTVRITPSGAKNYGIRYTGKDGRQVRFSLNKNFPTTTVSDAREEARILLGRIAAGADPAEEKKARIRGKLTLFSFINGDYGDHLRAHNRTGEAIIDRLKALFAEYGDRPLTDFDVRLIDKWRAARIKDGRKASTVNRDLNDLKSLFSRAVDWRLIPEHPLLSIKRMDESGGKIVRFLSDSEESRLRLALNEREKRDRDGRTRANAWRATRGYELLPNVEENQFVDHLKPAVLLSLNTGIRQGELLSLRWADIDLDLAILTVRDETAKSNKTRHLPLNDEAKSALVQWKSQHRSTELVFPGRDGSRMTEVKTAWGKLLKKAEIENFRWHDMRHHFASRLVMAGVDLNTVRELLGHSDIKMTLRYAHLAPEHKAAAVQKLMRTAA